MRWRALLVLTLAMFLFHALDADCLLRDCHCAPNANCSVPVTVQPAQAAVVPEQVTTVEPPRVTAEVQFPELARVAPPEEPPPLVTAPRGPPA